jgi:beta-lactamase class D
MKAILLTIFSFALCASFSSLQASAKSLTETEFKTFFEGRYGCFLIADLKTGKILSEYNSKRCQERFSPCSSFKIAAAVMAYDKGILKDENQVVKWDGVKRDREEINKDLKPFTGMSESAKWVTEWIMPKLGIETIKHFLSAFSYGNEDFSGGLKDSWVTSSLKISAHEQLEFLRKLWTNQLPVSKRSVDLKKKIILVKKLGTKSELFGKTGTGCLVGHACMVRPGKMLGWFVGVLESDSNEYVFAANASDLIDQSAPGGPRMRKTTISILEKMELVQ